eukprot:6727705-Alexandrium_andersonii.AAC.1
MSASLVGSEMCIRDSAEACKCSRRGNCKQPEAQPHACRPTQRGSALQHVPPQAAPRCLLYTSDAADDM